MATDDRFKQAMTEWVGIKSQLASVRKDLTVLNKREKELREFVTTQMIHLEIDAVKVKEKIKVNLKTKNTRGSITKYVILTGLKNYFHGDEEKAAEVFKYIQEAAPMKKKSTVSISGLKDLST